jgi:AcrR family transcriptional regulator
MKQSPLRAPYEPVEAPVRANRRVLSKLRTRQKVLEAARTLFTERGYATATIRDIAREAELSTGAVFANFEDKHDLFEAILSEDLEVIAERMRAAASETAGQPVEARLLALYSAGYGYYQDNMPLAQATLAHTWNRPLNAELRARTVVKGLIAIAGDVLRDAANGGELRGEFDVRLISEMIWDSYISNFRRAIYDNWSLETLQARLAEQIGVILAGIKS